MVRKMTRRKFIKHFGIGSFILQAPFIKNVFSKTVDSSVSNNNVLEPLKTGDKRSSKSMINDKAIDFKAKMEQVSIVVSIEKIDDDFSHPNGFQVILHGKSLGAQSDFDVEIVNIFKQDEKSRVDELVLKVNPGTSWLVTGDPLIFMENKLIVLFDNFYQKVNG